MSDELREQLGQLDPMHPGVTVEPLTTSSSQSRLEHIMNTPLIDEDHSTERSRRSGTNTPRNTDLGRHRSRNWAIIGSLAAAAIIAVGTAVVLGESGSDDPQVAAGPPLELSLGEGDALSSCMMFDVAFLADMTPAFAATATAVDGEAVTLEVDHWYAGGDAATVVLHGSGTSPALIAGFTFEIGLQYLITAAEGNVNFCGYSGLATPELTAAFDQAFGA